MASISSKIKKRSNKKSNYYRYQRNVISRLPDRETRTMKHTHHQLFPRHLRCSPTKRIHSFHNSILTTTTKFALTTYSSFLRHWKRSIFSRHRQQKEKTFTYNTPRSQWHIFYRIHHRWRIHYCVIIFIWRLSKNSRKNNTQFKGEFEASFKQEVADQLKTNNDSTMDKINQQFASF